MTVREMRDKLNDILDLFEGVGESEITLSSDPEGNKFYNLYAIDPGSGNTILWPGNEVDFDEQGT